LYRFSTRANGLNLTQKFPIQYEIKFPLENQEMTGLLSSMGMHSFQCNE